MCCVSIYPLFFSSLIDQNKALSGLIKLAHLNICLSDKVRDVIACFTGERVITKGQ